MEERNIRNEKYKYRILKDEISLWKEALPDIIKKLDLKDNKVRVIDVGAASGALLLAMARMKFIKQAKLVDPNWQYYQEEYLSVYGLNDEYFNKRKIEIVPKSGYDSNISYEDCDLIVKTFNPDIDWNRLVDISTAKYYLSDNHYGQALLKRPDLILISRCERKNNEYLLFERKVY